MDRLNEPTNVLDVPTDVVETKSGGSTALAFLGYVCVFNFECSSTELLARSRSLPRSSITTNSFNSRDIAAERKQKESKQNSCEIFLRECKVVLLFSIPHFGFLTFVLFC